jgi:flagellar hook assembly protein FlgD
VDAPPSTGRGLSLACWPNPLGSDARAVLAFTLPETTRVRVTIHDLRGAVVARVWDGVLPAGDQRLTWDRRDARGAHSRPGVYFATVESGGARASRRIVVLE